MGSILRELNSRGKLRELRTQTTVHTSCGAIDKKKDYLSPRQSTRAQMPSAYIYTAPAVTTVPH